MQEEQPDVPEEGPRPWDVQRIHQHFEELRQKVYLDHRARSTVHIDVNTARKRAVGTAFNFVQDLPQGWLSTEQGMAMIQEEALKMEIEEAEKALRDTSKDYSARIINPETVDRYMEQDIFDDTAEFGMELSSNEDGQNEDGEVPVIVNQVHVSAPLTDKNYYAVVVYTPVDNYTPLGREAARLLAAIDVGEEEQKQRISSSDPTPARDKSIAEIVLNPELRRGPVPMPSNTPGVAEISKHVTNLGANILPKDFEHLPPNDPLWKAFLTGISRSGGVRIMLLAKEAGQLDAFVGNVASSLEALVANGKVTTREQARNLFWNLVEAAIKDKSIYSRPSMNKEGDSVFYDDESWYRFIADMIEKVLLPIELKLKKAPARPKPIGKKGQFKNTEDAIKARQPAITDWFASNGATTNTRKAIHDNLAKMRSYAQQEPEPPRRRQRAPPPPPQPLPPPKPDEPSVRLDDVFFRETPAQSVQLCTETPAPKRRKTQRRPVSMGTWSLDDTSNVVPRSMRSTWRPISTPKEHLEIPPPDIGDAPRPRRRRTAAPPPPPAPPAPQEHLYYKTKYINEFGEEVSEIEDFFANPYEDDFR